MLMKQSEPAAAISRNIHAQQDNVCAELENNFPPHFPHVGCYCWKSYVWDGRGSFAKFSTPLPRWSQPVINFACNLPGGEGQMHRYLSSRTAKHACGWDENPCWQDGLRVVDGNFAECFSGFLFGGNFERIKFKQLVQLDAQQVFHREKVSHFPENNLTFNRNFYRQVIQSIFRSHSHKTPLKNAPPVCASENPFV